MAQIIRIEDSNGYLFTVSSAIKQDRRISYRLCSNEEESNTKSIKTSVFNSNPLSFADGYNLDPHDLSSYIHVFYYDVLSNASEHFGEGIVVGSFNTMQSNKTNIYFKQISVSQRSEPSNILAIAKGMYDNCKVEIQVSPEEWFNADNVRRLWIIYHELCHDIFNLTHETGIKLMNPEIPSFIDESKFLDARDELIEFIFNNNININRCEYEYNRLDNILNP